MAQLTFSGIKIKGIAACVPSQKILKRADFTNFFEAADLEKVTTTIGIEERGITDHTTSISDLCFKAAEELIRNIDVRRLDTDAVMWVSQTPNYKLSVRVYMLRHWLGLGKMPWAFDVKGGCFGHVCSLYKAYSFLQNKRYRNTLLLGGNTLSKTNHPKKPSVYWPFQALIPTKYHTLSFTWPINLCSIS